MMPSSMMLHSGMTVGDGYGDEESLSFRWIQMSGRILTEMVMATTVEPHNGTIPIMMVTEINGTLGDWFPNDPTKWQDSDWIR